MITEIEQFLTQLSATKDYTWHVNSAGMIRTVSRNSDERYCPITALCIKEKGARYTPGQYLLAADLLNIRSAIAVIIADAADGMGRSPLSRSVRAGLLHTLGLE